MVKKVGNVDKVNHRKTRSDLGKKRTRYKGQPCKHRKPKFYQRSKEGDRDSIIIRPLWRVPMSKDGYKNWDKTPWLKSKLRKEVTNMKLSPSYRVNLEDIDTKKKIEEWVATNKWEGKFVVMGISHGKTKTHRKWVNMCTIVVKETPEGNVGKMIQSKRLHRYWFYKG